MLLTQGGNKSRIDAANAARDGASSTAYDAGSPPANAKLGAKYRKSNAVCTSMGHHSERRARTSAHMHTPNKNACANFKASAKQAAASSSALEIERDETTCAPANATVLIKTASTIAKPGCAAHRFTRESPSARTYRSKPRNIASSITPASMLSHSSSRETLINSLAAPTIRCRGAGRPPPLPSL